MSRKRSRTDSSIDASYYSATRTGRNEQVDELFGVKTKDKGSHAVGHYKSKPFGMKDIHDMLNPIWKITTRFTSRTGANSNQMDSADGEQKVFSALDAMCMMNPRAYLQAIYEKMAYEMHIGNSLGAVAGPQIGIPTSNSTGNFFPDLIGSNHTRTYRVVNTGSTVSTITIIEYLCREMTGVVPLTYWNLDLVAAGAVPSVTTETRAPLSAARYTVTSTEVGLKPSSRGSSLSKFWRETRRTTYDVGPGQTIVHKIHHRAFAFPMSEIFATGNGATIQQFMPGISKAIMFLTHGTKGSGQGGTGGAATDNGKLITLPSWWNAEFEDEVTYRLPLRIKSYQHSCLYASENGQGWDTDGTLFPAADDKTIALVFNYQIDPQDPRAAVYEVQNRDGDNA